MSVTTGMSLSSFLIEVGIPISTMNRLLLARPYFFILELNLLILKDMGYLIFFFESDQTFDFVAPWNLSVGKNNAISHSDG
jgi:hypothetical protein